MIKLLNKNAMKQNASIKPEEPQLIDFNFNSSIGTIQFGYHLLKGIQEVLKVQN
jgi:hypothetical protein